MFELENVGFDFILVGEIVVSFISRLHLAVERESPVQA